MSEEKKVINVGGSIEKALVGDYTLDVPEILKEAFELTMRSRISINLGLLFCFMLGLVVTLIVSEYVGGVEVATTDPQASLLLNIMVTVVIYPFLVGVEMMGVYHAVGLSTKMNVVFAFLKRGSWVAVAALLTSSLISLGLHLVLPAIYLIVALCLVLPLVVEKQLSPIKAIVLSIKVTRFGWFAMLKLHLVFLLGLVIAVMPIALVNVYMPEMQIIGLGMFLVVMSYLAPVYYNVKGILYREIFGLTVQVSGAETTPNDDVFTA